MRFGPTPLTQAAGKILGHNIAGPDGRRILRKGKALTEDDMEALRQLGRHVVYVADLEPDDVEEDAAALRVARAVMGERLRLTGPSTGRVNLKPSLAPEWMPGHHPGNSTDTYGGLSRQDGGYGQSDPFRRSRGNRP
jgi:hypothetical protein